MDALVYCRLHIFCRGVFFLRRQRIISNRDGHTFPWFVNTHGCQRTSRQHDFIFFLRIMSRILFQRRNSLLLPADVIQPVKPHFVQRFTVVFFYDGAFYRQSGVSDLIHIADDLHLLFRRLCQFHVIIHTLHTYLPLGDRVPVADAQGDNHRD